MKVQAESFHLNGHIIGFRLQTQKLESPYKTPSSTLAVKGLTGHRLALDSIGVNPLGQPMMFTQFSILYCFHTTLSLKIFSYRSLEISAQQMFMRLFKSPKSLQFSRKNNSRVA